MAVSRLPLIGVEAVVLNSQEYFKTLGEMDKKTQATSKSLGKSTKSASVGAQVMKDLTRNTQGMVQALLTGIGVGNTFASSVSTWVAQIVAAAAPIAAVVAGIVALVTVIGALGNRASEIEGIRNAFYALNSQFGIMGDETLVKLREGALGTVSDLNLMKTTNLALAGSTDLIGRAYLQNFDKILTIAQVQARATGQSVEYLFDSLIRGIKRGSSLIIDNTGLIVSEADAHKKFADSIGVAVESLNEEQKQMALLNAVLAAGELAIEAAGGVQLTTAMKIQQMTVSLQNTFDRAAMAIKPLFDAIVDSLQAVLNVITPIVNFIIDVTGFLLKHLFGLARGFVSWIANLLKPITDFITLSFNLVRDNLNEMARGAGRTMAAYANGILQGLTQYIMPAILAVAQAISSFLIGQSPPPEGPLSDIFNGGAAVMDAWVQGFVGASLEPVSQVAKSVAGLMGGIATMSLKQVNTQLAQIHKFLKPFENRVALLEARFKSLDEVVQGAFKSIDAQQEALLEKLNEGDTAVADQIRTLDVEREKYQEILDVQKGVVDEAQYQLSMAKATVAAQLSALEIRKKAFSVEKKITEVKKKDPTAAKEKKPAAAKKAEEETTDATFGALASGESVPSESFKWLDDAAAAFGSGLTEGFDFSLIDTLGEQTGELGNILGGITPEAIGSNFNTMLGGFGQSFRDNIATPIRDTVWSAINWLTGDDEGSLKVGITTFVNSIPEYTSGLVTNLQTWFTQAWQNVSTTVGNLLTAQASPGSLAYKIANFGTNIATWLFNLPGTLLTSITTPFQTVADSIYDILFNPDAEGSLAYRFSNFFNGSSGTEGTLAHALQQALNTMQAFPLAVTQAFQGMGLIVWNAFAVPIITSMQSIIDSINNFIGQINETIESTADWVKSVTGIDFSGLAIPTIDIRLSTAAPSILGQAKGGLSAGPGAVRVNERGQEGFVLGSATQMMTFPNTFLSTLQDIRDILVTTVSAPMPATSGGNVTNSNTTYNFNGMKSVDEGRRAATMLRLFNK